MKKQDSQPTKNDQAWAAILSENPEIIERINVNGFYDINSSYLNQYRESRLLCKIDFKEKVPKPLKNEKLSVMAVRNGIYRLAHTESFVKIPALRDSTKSPPRRFTIPSHIKALSPQGISSEAKALDAALVSGMLDYVFDDEVSLVLRGYERSQRFRFHLKDLTAASAVRYDVDGVQIEVDGGYEGHKGIYLVEAKNKVNNNINLRQLLYPQLHFGQKFDATKPVQAYLMLYDEANEIFHFAPFMSNFDIPQDAGFRLDLKRHVICALKGKPEPDRDFWRDLRKVKVDESRVDSSIPFPQADDFNKIFAVYQQLSRSSPVTKEDLFANYAITPRQFDYYGNALCFLKLASYDRNSKSYHLSDVGRELASLDSKKVMIFEIAGIVMSNVVFNKVLHGLEKNVSKTDWGGTQTIADSTYYRRMQTVRSWVRYFQQYFQ